MSNCLHMDRDRGIYYVLLFTLIKRLLDFFVTEDRALVHKDRVGL